MVIIKLEKKIRIQRVGDKNRQLFWFVLQNSLLVSVLCLFCHQT